MPALIPLLYANGKRPSNPDHGPGTVPVLDVTEDTHALVGARHDAALDPESDTGLLTGELVRADNDRPRDGSAPGPITIHVAASTLHEAATECMACVAELAGDMPEWIAGTNAELARVLAEHFTVPGYSTCEAVPMEETA